MSRMIYAVLLLAFTHNAVAEESKFNPYPAHRHLPHQILDGTHAQTPILVMTRKNSAEKLSGEFRSPLRALWDEPTENTSCQTIVFPETGRRMTVVGNTVKSELSSSSDYHALNPTFDSGTEASKWLMQLFIHVNDLDEMLADVPLDRSGQQDCVAWNALLVAQSLLVAQEVNGHPASTLASNQAVAK